MKSAKYLSWFYTLNQSIRFFILLSMIVIIAYMKSLTPPEFSIRLFYLIPLFLSVWDGKGIIPGLFFSIICTCVYFYTESIRGNIHWHGIYLIWEFSIVCFYFITFVVIVDKLKKSNLSLSKKNDELEGSNKQKDKFFSIIAHDLRSPFQGFFSLTKMMTEEAGSYSAQEFANFGKEMHKTTDNLFSLLKNLLEWAQMQKGSMSFQPKDISLSNLIAENVQILKERSNQKEIEIINNVLSPFQVYADPQMVNSILLNLISNAVKFTNRNGVVTISARKTEDQMVEISISDTGIGMPKSLVDKLFIVGEKISSIGTDGELSTGLGLLLCKEFVEKNGGKIWVESEEGKGTTLSFNLPIK
jgi:signal transduction histidine kinase